MANTRPAAFSRLVVTDTAVGSLVVGGATPAATTGTGEMSSGAHHLSSSVPGDNAMKLYNNSGTLFWNGIPVATGSSVSGTTGALSKFTAPNALGDSIITESGTTITVTGTLNAVTALQLNGTSINTAGTLSNVAYQNQSNVFNHASGQKFSAGISIDGGTQSTHGIMMPSAVPGSLTTNLHNNGGTLKWDGGFTSGGNVSDSVGTMATIRAGGLGIASQAAGDALYATSSTQLGRVNGSGLLQLNGSSAPTVVAVSGVGAYKFVGEAHGTVLGGAGSTNVGNFAISGLTIYDSLFVEILSETSGTGGAVNLVNTTDTVTVFAFGNQNGNYYEAYTTISCSPITNTNVAALGINSTPALSLARSTFTTAYTGAWTLAVNVAPTNDWSYSVRVYKIVGQ